LHFAVAPAESALPPAAAGAGVEAAAVELAVVEAGADCDAAPDGDEVAGFAVPAGAPGVFCTPPWPLHAPRPVAAEAVPSLQVVDPAAGSAAGVMGAGLAPAEGDLDAFCTPPWPLHAPRPVVAEAVPSLQAVDPAADSAAGVIGAGLAAVEGDLDAFCMPPWPLHAPRPVAVDVVPSLQVVVPAVSPARLGTANTNINSGAARTPTSFLLFMEFTPLSVDAWNCAD
jgi:hypothetical protein